jgi:hypothetical protein
MISLSVPVAVDEVGRVDEDVVLEGGMSTPNPRVDDGNDDAFSGATGDVGAQGLGDAHEAGLVIAGAMATPGPDQGTVHSEANSVVGLEL